jgi:MFS family permease
MQNRILSTPVILAALGYFVDVFDIMIFSAVRVKSLTDLGLSGQTLTDVSLTIQNWQMVGLFIGGLAAGVIGDKIGRLKALYFSIALYSLGTILNGFANSVELYIWCRFIANIGLAGELGTGITLVAESLSTQKRGLGTTIVASFGMLGAVAVGLMGWFVEDWRTAYYIGGGMGVLLLLLRISVTESPIFQKVKQQTTVIRGNILKFATNKQLLLRLFQNTFLGISIWFNTGILMLLAPEFGLAKGIAGVSSPIAVIWFNVGMVLGDIFSGLLSQYLQKRLQAIRIFLLMQGIFTALFLFAPLSTPQQMYLVLSLLGFSGGYWAVFITNAAEQFGTNLRASAACVVPSLVRLGYIPISLVFSQLKAPTLFGSPIPAAAIVGASCLILATLASFSLQDTFKRDLEYLE